MESSSLSTDLWEETIDEFRSLGGIVENVRLAVGENGRGLFAIDPSRQARVWVPPELLVPVSETILGIDRRLIVTPGSSTVSGAAASFFARYQERYGWTPLREQAFETQRAWHDLPSEVRDQIAQSGALTNTNRFLPPSDETALAEFVHSRTGAFKGETVYIPVLELVNHRATASPYGVDSGVGIAGLYEGEVFARYNEFDSIDGALTYGFAERRAFALSVILTVELPGGRSLIISRNLKEREERHGYSMPVIKEHGEALELSFLMLGHLNAPVLPRATFRDRLAPYLRQDDADVIFDSLAHFNRQRWISVLRTLRRHSGPLITMLEDAVINQLEALSASVGGTFPT